ncbi:MAG: CDP-alcohol phosphatidyltransferase family protein [Caldilineaceae bacterium]|nr:CDP-alcohol phosphatidyltransferase family protein [Caldilineaceae bacterium]
MENDSVPVCPSSLAQRILAWSVHLITASGAVFGLFSLHAIHEERWLIAFWLMGAAVLVDGIDGTLARRFSTKSLASRVDGAMLDNIIDYLNYVIVPAFFLIQSDLLPPLLRLPLAGLITLCSSYQFCQTDAKTDDHFFKGFPSYWNIVVFYLFLWQLQPSYNALILAVLCVLVFVPIKYIYPSRLEYLSEKQMLRTGMLGLTLLWGVGSSWLLLQYPRPQHKVTIFLIAYMILYIGASIYRQVVPLGREAEESDSMGALLRLMRR